MPYIKKSEYEFILNKIRDNKDINKYNKLFDEYIRDHNYELCGFAHSDIKRKVGIYKPWKDGDTIIISKWQDEEILSDCCGAQIVHSDLCSVCGDHT